MTALTAVPAGASTTIGQLPGEGATTSHCSGGFIVWQIAAGGAVPGAASGGVITSVRTFQAAASAGHHFRLAVVSLDNTTFSESAQITVKGLTDPFTVAGAGAVEQFPARVSIAAGQGIAITSADGVECSFSTSDASDALLFNSTPEPPIGTVLHPQDGGTSRRADLQATIEPDADGDGFGDETQDTCPGDAGTHEGSCAADASVTATVTPSTIGVGDVAVMSGAVSNAGNATAADAVLHLTAGAGLNIVSSLPAAGCAFTTELACPLGSLAKGASVPFIIVVKATSTGTKALGASVTSTASDPNAGNNAAAGQVVVERQVPLACHVPKLTGLTKGQAKQLLAALHCKLGKATKKKSRKGRRGTVRKQSVKAGSTRPAGSEVNVTLRK